MLSGDHSEEERADGHQVIVPGSALVPVRDTAKGRAQLYENPAAFHLNWGWGVVKKELTSSMKTKAELLS